MAKLHTFRQNKRGRYSGVVSCQFCGQVRLVDGPERSVERLCSFCEYLLMGSDAPGFCACCGRLAPLCDSAPPGLYEEWAHKLRVAAREDQALASSMGLTLQEYRAWVDS